MKALPALAIASVIVAANSAHAQEWEYRSQSNAQDGSVVTLTAVVGDDGSFVALGCSNADDTKQIGAHFTPPVGTRFQVGDTVAVEYSIDDGPVLREDWLHTTVGAVNQLPTAEAFARAVRGAQRHLTIGAYGVSLVFSVKGSTRTIKRVMNDCGLD